MRILSAYMEEPVYLVIFASVDRINGLGIGVK